LTIKELGISVKEFSGLSKIDKKTLFYFRIMENYYIAEAHKKQIKKAKQEQLAAENKQKMMANLPRQNMATLARKR